MDLGEFRGLEEKSSQGGQQKPGAEVEDKSYDGIIKYMFFLVGMAGIGCHLKIHPTIVEQSAEHVQKTHYTLYVRFIYALSMLYLYFIHARVAKDEFVFVR